MSIRFPTDDNAGMSGSGAPRRRGGGGFFFLLILGAIAFMVMRGMSSSPGPSDVGETNPADRRGVTQYPDLQQDPAPRTDQGDWGMDTDVAVQRNASSKKANADSPTNNKTRNGDWGAEEVSSTKKEQPAGRFSQPSNNTVTTPKKPATQGDWGLDTDVDSTLKPTVPKKTVEGDWGLEQVE